MTPHPAAGPRPAVHAHPSSSAPRAATSSCRTTTSSARSTRATSGSASAPASSRARARSQDVLARSTSRRRPRREAIEKSGVDPEQIDAVHRRDDQQRRSRRRRCRPSSPTASARTRPPPTTSTPPAPATPTAIAQADALIRAGAAHYALVVGAEKLSRRRRPHRPHASRSCSATAPAPSSSARATRPASRPTVWGSDGSKADAVGMNAHARRSTATAKAPWPTLRQEGQTVFRWAVWEMAKVAKQALEAAGVDRRPISPRSSRTRRTCASSTSSPSSSSCPTPSSIGRDIETTGNTSAASIPLATHRLLEEHPELSGGLALQIGFGAGLVFGAQVVVLP